MIKIKFKKPTRSFIYLSTCCAMSVLVACGGGGSSDVAGVGSGGTGFVTGFGSVIIDGIKYDDSRLDASGAVRSEDGLNDVSRTRDDIKLGQRVEVEFEGSAATGVATLVIQNELLGPVTADTTTAPTGFILVAGQRVAVNADATKGPLTVFEGASSLSQFAIGDRVEVHGLLTSDNVGPYFLASRIERKPSTDAAGAAITKVKLSGTVSDLAQPSAGITTFKLAGVTVTVNSNSTITPTPASLVNGQRVKVFADDFTTANTPTNTGSVTATAVRVKKFNASKGEFRVRGVVSNVDAVAKTFMIDALIVDASAAGLVLPAEGTAVRVRGSYDAATNTVKASQIKSSDDLEVKTNELKGSVSDYISASDFVVRGTRVDARALDPLVKNRIENGVFVEVKGSARNDAGFLVATSVEFKTPSSGNELELNAAVSGLDTGNSTFSLDSQLVNYSNAVFKEGSAASLADGVFVEAKGRLVNNVLQASVIEVRSSDSNINRANEKEVEGRLAADATGSPTFSFTINGITVTCTSATVGSDCSANALKKGSKFKVRYTSGMPNTATRLRRDD